MRFMTMRALQEIRNRRAFILCIYIGIRPLLGLSKPGVGQRSCLVISRVIVTQVVAECMLRA